MQRALGLMGGRIGPMTDEDMRFVSGCIAAQTLFKGIPRTKNFMQTLLSAANSVLSGKPDGEAIQAARNALAMYGK